MAAVVFAGFNFDAELKCLGSGRRRLVGRARRAAHGRPGRSQRTWREERHQARRPAGFRQRAGSPEHFRAGAPALPQRCLVQSGLFPAPAIGSTRFQRHSGSGRTFAQQLAAADCADLSWHRPLRPAAPLDRSRIHALLHFLPSLVHRLLLQVHRQAERLRLDHLLGQHRRRSLAAGAVSCTSS